jgi:hypothetical protein
MVQPSVSPRWLWVIAAAIAWPLAAHAQLVHCDLLRTSDSAFAGRCVRDSSAVGFLVLRPPPAGSTGRWNGTYARVFGTAGDSTKDVIDWQAFSPVFVDVDSRDSLFTWCWCVVTRAAIDTEGLHFDADSRRIAPPTAQDLAVLEMARSYFGNPAQWNRRDDRSRGIGYCPRNPVTRTLFCALYEATIAVRGEFYLTTPAIRAVQQSIGAASPREYQHPLTDFNNDPLIDFTAVTATLDDAVRRTREVLAKAPGGA